MARSISIRLNRQVVRFLHGLHEESVALRIMRSLKIPWNDDVQFLRLNPLGMFFYNQRALVFGASAAIWIALLVIAKTTLSREVVMNALYLLGVLWLLAIATTLILHQSFKAKLLSWSYQPPPRDAPPLFDKYFLVDSAMVAGALLIGHRFALPTDGLYFLLLANTFLYSAYSRSYYSPRLWISSTIYCISIASLIFIFDFSPGRDLMARALYLTPLAGMILITLFSISMISWLRTFEHGVTRDHLTKLGDYEALLAPGVSPQPEGDEFFYNEKHFRARVAKLLDDLCSQQYPSWYSSACLWLAETHRDRGSVLLPSVLYNFDEAKQLREGVDEDSHFLQIDRLILSSSVKHDPAANKSAVWRFRTDLDAPAALIPLQRDGVHLGVLALYGKEGGPPALRQEEAFLQSLGSILANTMEQWEGRYQDSPQKEMDSLFACESLDEVFPRAALILRKYLFASGCMILFRPDPEKREMVLAASVGFKNTRGLNYVVGRGQTGKCAEEQVAIRFDDVDLNKREFDDDLLKALERSHGRKISSWMAIPIGKKGSNNYGVVKVVNSSFRCSWFTPFDQRIGEGLALRLHVIIERYLQIRRTEHARLSATKSAQAAEKAQREAESTAKQRQQDLMNVTHQLQGALISVVGALTGISDDGLTRTSKALLNHGRALVEDALALAYGTFTSLARAAGRETAFVTAEINAPEELRSLSRRLKMTNARDDLTFRYNEEAGFPVLKMDRNVFTSVLFSLVHNAMKYADRSSEVILECSFERSSGEAALKVKSTGEPIDPIEREKIFEKFSRGRAVERGRMHSGVGLGLWVARELMKASGGDLTVELSPYNPRFSVFIVHVPKAGSGGNL